MRVCGGDVVGQGLPPGLRRCTTGPGGGGTDSLSLGTNCETAAPLFDKIQPLVLPSRNLQLPLFIDTQEQPLEISIKLEFFCIAYVILYQIIVLKGFKNKSECIQLLYDVEYWIQRP